MTDQGPLGQPLGMVVDGSLSRGVEVRLDSGVSVEDIQEGTYVTIKGEKHWFFGMVTDVSLGAVDSRLKLAPPDVSNPFIAEGRIGVRDLRKPLGAAYANHAGGPWR